MRRRPPSHRRPSASSDSNIMESRSATASRCACKISRPAGVAADAMNCAARLRSPAGRAFAREQRQDGQTMRVRLASRELRFQLRVRPQQRHSSPTDRHCRLRWWRRRRAAYRRRDQITAISPRARDSMSLTTRSAEVVPMVRAMPEFHRLRPSPHWRPRHRRARERRDNRAVGASGQRRHPPSRPVCAASKSASGGSFSARFSPTRSRA